MADVVSSLLEAGAYPSLRGAMQAMLWLKTPFAPVAMVYTRVDTTEVYQIYGIHTYHLLVCDALDLDQV
jgi:hypothetical protein